MLLKTNIADANKRLFKEPESGAAPEKLKFSGADYRPATPKSGIHQLPSEQTLNAIQSSGDDLGSIEISLAVKKRCSFCLSILIRSVVILASFYFSAVFSNIPFEQLNANIITVAINWIRVANMVTDPGSQYALYAAQVGQTLNDAQQLVSSTPVKTVSAFAEFASSPNVEQRFRLWAIDSGRDTLLFDNILLSSQKAYTYTIGGGKNDGRKSTSIYSFLNVLPY